MVKKGLWNVTHIHWFLKGPSFHLLLSLQAKLWSKKLAKRSLVVVLCRSVLLLFQKHKRKHLLSKKRTRRSIGFFQKFFFFLRSRAWSTAISSLFGTCWYEHICKTSRKKQAIRSMKTTDAKSSPRWSAKTPIRY